MLFKKNINFLDISFGKSNLIEASAGTGKTNLISLLYLRFLFGINLESEFLSLNLNNILVVTFTELAVLEIKNRILSNIRNLRVSLVKKEIVDDKIKDIYLFIKDRPNILNIVLKYEYNYNNFSVFTIHSFVKRMLFSNFLNSKINFNDLILVNENDIIYNIVIKFWRKYFYFLSVNISKIISSYWPNPFNLFKSILPFLNFNGLNFNYNYNYSSISECYKSIVLFIDFIKKKWFLNSKYIYKNFVLFKKNNVFYKNLNLNKLFIIIDEWCKEKTIDFNLPKCLINFSFNFLSQRINNLFIINSDFYHNIDFLFIKIKDLYNYVIVNCYKYVVKENNIFKCKNSYLSFNDLITKFHDIIIYNYDFYLINNIRKNYPLILIDEFQDTDVLQYNIFSKIYVNNFSNLNTKIIFVGDPKQSIYSFRGANIFNYIKAKKNIDFLYTFNVNWRSSYMFIKSLNYLFTRISNPFIFCDTKYNSVNYSFKSKFLLFTKINKPCSSINFFVINNVNVLNIKDNIAKYCAYRICNLLNNIKYKISFFKDNVFLKRNIIPSDIAVLTYSNVEIKIIFDVFKEFNLPIDCNLDNSSIFDTVEAREVLLIIKAVLKPESNFNIRNVLSTFLFNLNILCIEDMIINHSFLNNLINEFNYYYGLWDKNGIFVMLKKIFSNRYKYIKYYNQKNYLNYKNNFFHLAEILEDISYKVVNKYCILNWLTEKVFNLNSDSFDINNEYCIRSHHLSNGIKVSTIHKCKGLQYNIVFLPFLFNLKSRYNFLIYHNRKNYKPEVFFNKTEKDNFFFNEELCSEEMRLLYVSITRSIYQCNIFIYEFKKGVKRNFYSTPIGRLIFSDRKIDFLNINNVLSKFNCKYIGYKIVDFKSNWIKKKMFYIISDYENQNISLLKDKYIINNKKEIFNYSKITSDFFVNTNKLDLNNLINFNKKINNFIPFDGKNLGIFFHVLLEKINFNNSCNYNFLILKYMYKFNILKKYFFCIKRILFNVLNFILFPLTINLSDKKISFYYKEFDFFLYIVNSFSFSLFSIILKKYNFFSKNYKKNNFMYKLKGFLNGVIDLIFVYKSKFFIVDFKTNFLGFSYDLYNKKKISDIISYYGYDIQYLIYSLALHNYLKLNIKNYNYNYHFGGIYYIFLQGLMLYNNNMSYTGFVYLKPDLKLIKTLNFFFKRK